MQVTHKEIAIKEIDFVKDATSLNWWQGTEAQGMYTALRASDLIAQNSIES